MEILVFGGTVEGRKLVEWLSATGACEVVTCAATEYGGQLVEGCERVTSLVGPLSADEKERLVAEHDFACVVDATHPYATHVTSSISALAEGHGLPLLRLVRDDAEDGPFTVVADVEGAARAVAACQGNVLLTTGVKDLPTFTSAMPDFPERLFVRILPVESSVAQARELGIPASHIVAMQGPFSTEMNVAIARQLGICTMVTKASGKTGGFQEKVEAAQECGMELVVIARPEERGGLPYERVQEELARMMGLPEASGEAPAPAGSPSGEARDPEPRAPRRAYLVGIGLGAPETLTVEAVNAIEASDLLIGAKRMIEPYADGARRTLDLIRSEEIARALLEQDYSCASVLFSGDVGFYSGATSLARKLSDMGADQAGIEVRAVPGISSVVCLCARLLTPWQDVHLVSAHGRECDPAAEVRGHAKTFMLTGGKTKARDVCRLLVEAGLGDVAVHVGERLSYPDERIVHGTASELSARDFADLAVMLVENQKAPKHEPGKLEPW